jgi:hypothetical protein
MKTSVDLPTMKDWLGIDEANDDANLNARLSGLLLSAATQVADACDMDLVFEDADTIPAIPEPINTAIKFRTASWFETPVPDADQEAAAQNVVNNLIAKYRVVTYPPTPTVTDIEAPTGTTAGGTSVTITGRRFDFDAECDDSMTVRFGDVYATDVVVVSNTELTCVTPAHDAGEVDVKVSNRKFSTTARVVGGFTYS